MTSKSPRRVLLLGLLLGLALPMSAEVLEVVRFRTKPGVTAVQLFAAARKSDAFITQAAGFLSRRTAVSADGTYLDLVVWRSEEAAKQAAASAATHEAVGGFFALIDEATIDLAYYQVPPATP